jgi:NADH:ubiquinone oxidoreductase subunit 6 (subunit J)
MEDILILAFLAVVTLVPAAMVFLSKRLLNSVISLAMSAIGSALVLVYVSQTFAALIQLLVFVGSLSTYLIVAVASEEKEMKMLNVVKFIAGAVAIAAVLSYIIYIPSESQPVGTSFTEVAASAFLTYPELVFVSVFLQFAATIGSILIIKKVSVMVF